MTIPRPTGINRRINEYYQLRNHVRTAKEEVTRASFLSSSIVAVVEPATQALLVGDALSTITNYSTITNTSNYSSEAGTIVSAVVQVDGVTQIGSFTVSDGESVTVLVTDSAANTRTWSIDPNVRYAAAVNTVAPVVSGDTSLGDVLSTTNGTWTGAVGGAFSYQWERNGVDIPGATATSYMLMLTDSGADITCDVTYTNSGGSPTATSNAITVDTFLAPTVSASDSLSGRTLTVTIDSSTGSPTPTFAISGNVSFSGPASGPWTYTAPSSSTGTTVNWTVTATNALNTDTSSGSEVIAADLFAPAITGVPAISGTQQVGETLTATAATPVTGTAPITRTWQWTNSVSGDIPGADSISYTLQASDETDTITVRQIETNAIGSATATSLPTGAIQPAPVGATLTVTNVSETPVIDFTNLPAGTAVTITIQSGYGAGTYTDDIDGTPLTVGALETAPMCIVQPLITGTLTEGETLTREQGYWLYAGAGSVSLSGDWVNDADGSKADSSLTYLLVASDVDDTMSVAETASPTGGATFTPVVASSLSTDPIASSAFDPATLFTGGRGGLWYELDDTSTVWTDTLRTINVSASGDSVAYIDDKSGNGHDMQVIASSVATWEDVGGEQYLDNVSGGFESVQDYVGVGPETISIFRAWRSTDPSIGLLITNNGGVFISCNDGQTTAPPGGVGSPEYATNGGAIITPTPNRDGLHTAWITGNAVVSEAQNVDFPSGVRPRILDYPSGTSSDGAAEIFAEIWVEEPVTAQERSDIVAYLQGKYV